MGSRLKFLEKQGIKLANPGLQDERTAVCMHISRVISHIQSNLSYPNADYPKLLGYSKTMDSPDFFLYYLLQ